MKLAFLLLTFATFVTSIFAWSCTPGRYYCGRTLLQIGGYDYAIERALEDHHIFPRLDVKERAYFTCDRGGGLVIQKVCKSCRTGSAVSDDICY
ncbi:hypothetical protein VTN00DRAFT_3003 [Thermoascus crustaceus]|uniref:uncharacterized protein n=1 Tax=Thermoascus crustaceus TaxID=5088 RepID=UPI0037421D64